MTRAEYLAELNLRIQSLPQDERDSAMRYYVEYFDDAGEGNEQQVIGQLGSPTKVAQQLIGEGSQAEVIRPIGQRKRGFGTWLLIILGSPVWIPLCAAALCVLVALLLAALCVLLALAMLAVTPLFVSATMLLGGAFCALMGMLVGLGHIPTALWFFGMGLTVLALGGLLFKPCLTMMQRAMRWIFQASAWMMKKIRFWRRRI